MGIEIKKPAPEDEEIFVRLSLELAEFNRQQHQKHHDFEKLLRIRKERIQRKFRNWERVNYRLLLLAYLDGKPVGYGSAYLFDSMLGVGCYDEMFVRQEARGKGIGKALLNTVTEWMREKKMTRMMISVYCWNDRAKALYESQGFTSYAVSYEKNLTEYEAQ